MEALIVSTVALIVGELGDKTQILSLILAARLRHPLPIIAGIFVATVANNLLACAVGEWVSVHMAPYLLRWVLGISFLGVAVWALIPDKMDEEVNTKGHYGIFMLVAATFFLAEMGDKTQVAAMALAAKYKDILSVVAGTTLGMMIVNVPTVLLSKRALTWIPIKLIRYIAAAIYAALGVASLLGYLS